MVTRLTYKFRLSIAISWPNVGCVDLIFQRAPHILSVCKRIALRNSTCSCINFGNFSIHFESCRNFIYFDKTIIMRNFHTGQLIKKDLDVAQMLLYINVAGYTKLFISILAKRNMIFHFFLLTRTFAIN